LVFFCWWIPVPVHEIPFSQPKISKSHFPFYPFRLQNPAKMSGKKATQMIKICFGFHEKFAEWTRSNFLPTIGWR
jgi:hypothetical protein